MAMMYAEKAREGWAGGTGRALEWVKREMGLMKEYLFRFKIIRCRVKQSPPMF